MLKPEPSRIEPVFSERLWGSKSLAPLYPEKTNLVEPIGEAWLTGLDCPITTGPFAGKKLGQAWHEMPADWRGTQFSDPSDFPLLLKFIFPTDKLSIQVHPDDAYAAAHEQAAGGRGKTEMWHIVSAQPGAQLLAGLKPGVTREEFLNDLSDHSLEELFQAHLVKAGDTFFIPAGTPHTIGPNMVVFEVQEYSDLTYRVYDYGRVDSQGKPRELHIQKALEVLSFDASIGRKIAPLALAEPGANVSLLAACRYFSAERIEFSERYEIHLSPGHFELLVILEGRGNLGWPTSAARYNAGECWLLPAALASASLNALTPTSIIRAYVPDVPALQSSLHAAGISTSAISQTVFP
jgi:mannose-6-phosphate isomerase